MFMTAVCLSQRVRREHAAHRVHVPLFGPRATRWFHGVVMSYHLHMRSLRSVVYLGGGGGGVVDVLIMKEE